MSIYEFEAKSTKGENVSLKEYEGKVVLIVNTATGCGFTPQYEDLENLYKAYKDKGLVILDFPCNQFGHQAPGTDEEIVSFCSLNYGVTFPQFSKIEVNGEGALPLFKYLKEQKGFAGFYPDHKLTPVLDKKLSEENPDYKNQPDIKWNFTKFLIDRQGNVVERFEPTTDVSDIEEKVKDLL
jgi:glutathione peroxidase